MDPADIDDLTEWAETAEDAPERVLDSLDEIIASLVADRSETRNTALRALIRIAREYPGECTDAIPKLATSLGDTSQVVRYNAALALEYIAEEHPEPCAPTITGLVEGLTSDDGDVRQQCRATLNRVEQAVSEQVADALDAAVADALDRLSADDEVAVNTALLDLARLADAYPASVTSARQQLRDHLERKNDVLRYHAALALKRIATEHPGDLTDGIDAPVDRLDDPDADVREACGEIVEQLAATHPPTIVDRVPALVDALQDVADTETREHLRAALHTLAEHDPSVVRDAVAVDLDPDADAGAVHEAIEQVASTADADTTSTNGGETAWLADLSDADDPDPERVTSRRDKIEQALSATDAEERNWAARALSGVADTSPGTVVEFLPSLRDRIGVETESVIRYNLVLAVRRVAADRPDAVGETIPTLIDVVTTDTDDDVIRTAALALSDVAEADPDVIGHEWLPQIADGFHSADAKARLYVAWTLDEAARERPDLVAETAPALAGALDDSDTATRNRATRALVRLVRWDPSVVREHAPTLVSTLVDGDNGVADISGRVEYDTLRADDDGTACDYTSGSCAFVYFGESDMWGCPHPSDGGDRCPFHQPVTETDDGGVAEAFLDAVAREGKPTKEFYGAMFGDFDISHAIIDAPDNYPIMLKGVTFEGDVDWSEVTVNHEMYFNDADFEGAVDFTQAVFERLVGFQRATFDGTAEFVRFSAGGNCHFDNASFDTGAAFDQATFGLDVHFTNASFGGDVDFFGITADQYARFDGATVDGDLNARSASFRGPQSNFTDCVVSGDGTFNKASFATTARFGEAEFGGSLSVRRAAFEGVAGLQEMTIGGEIDAASTRFADRVFLKATTVDGVTDLTNAEIGGKAFLMEIECGDDLLFDEASLGGKLTLQGAVVDGVLSFKRVDVNEKVQALASTIDGAIRLEDGQFSGPFLLGKATVRGQVSALGTTFGDRVLLSYSAFDGPLAIKNAEFRDEIACRYVTASGPVSITRTWVGADGTFSESAFEDDVRIDDCTFEADVDCLSSRFQDVSFEDTTVSGDLSLYETEITSLSAVDADVADSLDLGNARVTGPLTLAGAVVGDRLDLTGVILESGGDFSEMTVSAADFTEVEARADLCIRDANFDSAVFADLDLPPSTGRVDLSGAALLDGRIAMGNSPVVYDFTDGTVGEVTLDGTDDLFDYIRFVGTAYQGFDFSRHKGELEAAGWKIHEIVDDVAPPAHDMGDAGPESDLDLLATSGTELAESKREMMETIDEQRQRTESLTGGTADSEAASEASDTERPGVTSLDDAAASTPDPSRGATTDTASSPDRTDRPDRPDARERDLTPGQLENTYLKSKNGANDIGDNTAAAEFFLNEMRYRRAKYANLVRMSGSTASTLQLGLKWLSNAVLDVSCGYGERPSRTVYLSVAAVLVFAGIYAALGLALPYSGATGYLIFSLESFVALVLGQPQTTNSITTFTVALESFLGGFIIALFVFALTRSINR